MRQAVTPDQDITPERVRWFADYHAKEPAWGVFHVSLDDGNFECGAADMDGEEHPADVMFMADWFDGLTEDQREELARRVAALEEVRRQDAPSTERLVARELDSMVKEGLVVQVPPRHVKTWTAPAIQAAPRPPDVSDEDWEEIRSRGFTAPGWTGDAAYHDELAAGRLGEQARRVYGWVLEAQAQNGGDFVTGAEALDKRVRNVNLYRARMTELFYQGALVKGPPRECKVTHRQAITWRAVPPPWTPVDHRRTGALVLRPLLREAAALIRELATSSEAPTEEQAERAVARAREYDRAAADGYGGGRNPNGRV